MRIALCKATALAQPSPGRTINPGRGRAVPHKQKLLTNQLLLAMKLTAFLLLVIGLQVSATGRAQKISLSEKNASLEKVFRQIQRQTGYQFIYTVDVIQKARTVDISVRSASLETVLAICFRDQPLTYSIVEEVIVVKEKEEQAKEELEFVPFSIDLSGKVTDPEGFPLEGATIKVKGTLQGTTTNAKGEFTLYGVEEDAVLEVSFVGFTTRVLPVAANPELKSGAAISLKRSENKLDEIQIQAYGTTSLRRSTGNITTIKAEEIAKQPVDNPLLALQARVPGLIITPTSGLPGAPIKLQIRGQNSLLGKTSEPLIVIDGVPFANNVAGANSFGSEPNLSALRFINPSDIASIDVLKDADATAIYGNRFHPWHVLGK